MPRRPPPPPSYADALDRLRELVEADGRSQVEIGEAIDPPMSRSQLHQLLSGGVRAPSIETVARILAAVGRTWSDLD